MTSPETARRELNEFLSATGIQSKVIANKLGWSYINFLAFKTGKKNYSAKRSTELHNFLAEYKKMISQL